MRGAVNHNEGPFLRGDRHLELNIHLADGDLRVRCGRRDRVRVFRDLGHSAAEKDAQIAELQVTRELPGFGWHAEGDQGCGHDAGHEYSHARMLHFSPPIKCGLFASILWTKRSRRQTSL